MDVGVEAAAPLSIAPLPVTSSPTFQQQAVNASPSTRVVGKKDTSLRIDVPTRQNTTSNSLVLAELLGGSGGVLNVDKVILKALMLEERLDQLQGEVSWKHTSRERKEGPSIKERR